MNLLDFYRQYPDESSCEEALRRFRDVNATVFSVAAAAVCV